MAVVGAAQGQAAEAPTLRWPRMRLRMLLVAAIVSGLTSVTGIQLIKAQQASSAGYQQARAQADAALAQALSQGYSADDLSAITLALDADRGRVTPFYFSQAGFYDQRRTTILGLLSDLTRLEAEALTRRRATAKSSVDEARTAIDTARAQGAGPEQLDPIRGRLDKIAAALPGAASPKAVDGLIGQTAEALKDATDAGAAATAEQAKLTQAADALKARYQGNVDQIRAAANAAVVSARNDGTVATMLKIGGTASLVARLERYASLFASPDVSQVALGAAGAQTFQQKLHDLLLSTMPAQTITLSLTAQELWAYQDGKVVQDTLVTTGRPALPTDVGAMKVLWKQSPWKMHSPWPRSSPYWYPDTYVKKVVWFTVTGEGLHDASWQRSMYGPGGQFTVNASHGCVHVQMAAENFLYDWANVGTPVIVYPGDGTPVSEQMKQVSVDDNGVPFTGPKGA